MPAGFSTTNILGAPSATWRSGVGTGFAPASTDATDPAFPPRNLATYRAGKVCRFKARTAGVIEVDLPAAGLVDVVALLNHNLHPAADVKLSMAAAPAGPWETIALTLHAGSCWMPLPVQVSRRYFRLVIANAMTVDTRPVQIGELFLGIRQALPPFRWGAEEGVQTISSFLETEFGVPVAHFLSERRTFRGSFIGVLPAADAAVVNELKRSVQSRVRPFLFLPDLADLSQVMLGRFATESWVNERVLPGRVGGLDFTFREDPFGKTGA